MTPDLSSRRRFLGSVASTSAALAAASSPFFTTRGLFAQALEDSKRVFTPALTEGPFYPDRLPLDTDNDLIIINDATTPAVGAVTHLTGRVLDKFGDPVRNALLEIWQVDGLGSYIHSHGTNRDTGKHDTHFQGYGRFLTASSGEFYFRTIKPVPYPGRTPHIHVKVHRDNREVLTTQFFIKGHPQNARDGIFRGVRSEAAMQTIVS